MPSIILASAIGAASSRLVLSLLLRKRTVSTKAALKLLDDANAAIQYNREILQTALDHVRQGIAVFDKDLQLVCWNRQFGEILDLPPALTRVGVGLDEILRHNAERGALGPGRVDDLVRERITRYLSGARPIQERFAERGLVVEIRANPMPDGGIVTTATDITPSVEAAEALERANENLERRVKERTEELTRLNAALARAKGEAEEANVSKTRFLAAASHDILQPLNAARLYVTSLVERQGSGEDARLVSQCRCLARSGRGNSRRAARHFAARFRRDAAGNLDLPHRRADAPARGRVRAARAREGPRARLRAELARGALRPAAVAPPAAEPRLERDQIHAAGPRADRLPPRAAARLRIDVYDTGLGIPQSKKRVIFREFHRLDQGAKVARGLGLGLSIVERIARVLDHQIELQSKPGRGSHFSVEVPLAPALPSDTRARAPQPRRRQSARRHAGAVHRQRAEDPRRHGDAARRLGLPACSRRRT